MGKYDEELRAIAGMSDRDQQKALWSIANEIAELTRFLRKNKLEENKDALEAIEREFGVEL